MKRVVSCTFSACLLFGSLGLTGCDSGGIPEGQPVNTKPDSPLLPVNAADGPKMPKDAPKTDAATPPAPDAAKK